jgi:hypothetical protein
LIASSNTFLTDTNVTLKRCDDDLKIDAVWCGKMLSPNDPTARVISAQRNFGEKRNYDKNPGPGYSFLNFK